MYEQTVVTESRSIDAVFLLGEFTCQACRAVHTLFTNVCTQCGTGLLQPVPLVLEYRSFLYSANEMLQVIKGKPWNPRRIRALGIELHMNRSRRPVAADFSFVRKQDKKPAGNFSMTLGLHPGDIVLEARLSEWGPNPAIRFERDEFRILMREEHSVKVTVGVMVPVLQTLT